MIAAPLLFALLTLGVQTAPDEAGPRAVLSETIVDFGTMPRGEKAERKITLENRGSEPLEIRHVRSNCVCTVLDAPSRIGPGEKAELTLQLDTESLNGMAQAIVNLFTNDPAAPRLDVTVKVESRPYVWAEPPEFRYIVYQHFDGSGLTSAKVAASSPADFHILGIESPLEYLDVSYREAKPEERLAGSTGSQYVIEATLDPAAPVGPLSGWVRVHTDHEKQKLLSISVSGFVRPMMHVTPPEAELGTVTLGDEPIEWSHHVRNFAVETVEITRTETDVPGLTVEVRPGENDHEFFLVLRLAPDAAKGPVRGTVTVHTTSEKVPRIEVPVRGTIAGP